ncbi:3-isopropylmalate dehydrogenase [Acidomonas methanolica]|uniref:3-isopropylmalate dehydrogenase n=1 Tax=Acidomonas methanolica NBRC 104435 TaxID=1231351 RepID=A0A023D6B9_ACIMT|nr:3-isopropylmalate dehydrogenase [Acidomonas methanolica]MBU2655479.1 3-isopropylmalate dehydrogenase [Acidomonas methanolica]TCS21735.1 3-isopropylmalate dehydrogenase [Acidomonas methanolica]GAJ29649.1 3-isopropylmalate/isocitrate dehydrogenase [Acidomonas methanolica NBRC 104435]GBQ52072.1 3-isopropylmalate dehydrogenase [Acidomonas methanolica]GEL00327.1 3-isopropylmalate dehydrogenase [Acidomonas methanolica NBRC 104435]
MSETKKLLVLPGDGIGPEVMREVAKVVQWLQAARGLKLDIAEELVGGASLAKHGVPIRDEVIALAKEADAVLFGSVGDPAWAHVGFDRRPEVAILRLRSELELFANLRPAKVFDALIDASTLKPDVVRGLDIMIVRETVGGIYFGEPRGIETLPDGSRRGVNTEVYTTGEIERVARVAFDLARVRRNRVTSIEKCNVMESGLLWKEVVTDLRQRVYPDVELTHMLADNCAMQLVRNPLQFDVLVTGNLFGDLLSDLAAMLTGSLGMLPSATLGAEQADGKRHALYEPIHGSAPDIAGKGIANPLAQILSFAMLLRYSFDREADAVLIETAVSNVLASGLRTADIMSEGMARVGTSVMGDAVVKELGKLAG